MSLVGLDVGPTLDLYSDVDGYTTPFETGVLRVDLEAGYTSSLVPDLAISIRVYSIGVCTNYAQCSIAIAHGLAYSAISCEEACSTTPVIYYSQCSELILYYCYLWTDPSLTSAFEAPAGFYSDGINCYDYRFPHSGFIAITPCGAPPVTSYNCESGTCIEVSGSGGTYPTLLDCEAVCTPPNVDCTIYNDACTPVGSIIVFPGDGASVGLYYRIAVDVMYYVNSFTSATPDHTQTMGSGSPFCPVP